MSSDTDIEGSEGYVHRPADGDGPAERRSAGDADAAADGFGRAGWILVAAVVLSVLVVPGAIYLYPAAPGELGLTFFAAMLALPFLPALILGLTAVWSMTAATGSESASAGREHGP